MTVSAVNSTLTVIEAAEAFVDNEAIQYIYTINFAIVCGTFCLFGIATNTVNIIVFIGMKFKDTINIALLGLAISDLCSLVSLLWVCICFNPLFMYSDVPILTFELQHKPGGWTHILFARVTAFITVYITLERCLCIAFPLKIKTLLMPSRVFKIIIGIYVVIIGSLFVNFFNVTFVWKFVPDVNRTMLGMMYTDDRIVIQTVSYYLNVIYIMTSFIGVVTCSFILIWKLKQRGRWLNSATTDQSNSNNARDNQVVKMVITVAVIFIISFTPSVMFFATLAVESQLNVGGKYQNLFFVFMSITYIFEAINSSVNIFVFYNMSSKFARTFRLLFMCCPKKKAVGK